MLASKLFVITVAFLALSGCKDEKNQQNASSSSVPVVQAVRVEPHDIPLSFEYAARVQGSKETEVRARVGGILLKRNYVEGSKVKEGDVLFQIDPEPFEVELLQAKAELSQNEANLKAAETQWERISKLFNERIVSEKSRDEARADLDALRASTALAEAKVKSAQLNLNYTTVRAPISGITSMETQSEGSLIAVNAPMTTITQFNPAYVIFSASENEIFKLGSMVEQGLIVNPRHSKTVYAQVKYGSGKIYEHDGEINFVNPGIDETTGTLKLRAVFPNPENRLVPGQFVRLVLEGLIRKNAIIVPQEAVMQGADGSVVYRINSQGIVESVPVQVGLTTPDGSWIIDKGLNTGDVVIVNGIMKVRPGTPAEAEIKELPVPVVPAVSEPAETVPADEEENPAFVSEEASPAADVEQAETEPVEEGFIAVKDTEKETAPEAAAPAVREEGIMAVEEKQPSKEENIIILEEIPADEEEPAFEEDDAADAGVYTDKVLSRAEQNELFAG